MCLCPHATTVTSLTKATDILSSHLGTINPLRKNCVYIKLTNELTGDVVEPVTHDDTIKWKHFLRNWPFVRGIHRSIPSQRPVTRSFDVFFDLRLNERLNKKSWGW